MRKKFDINNCCNFCGNNLIYVRYLGKKLKTPHIRKHCTHCGMIKLDNYKYSLFEDINCLPILDYTDKSKYQKTLYGRFEAMNSSKRKQYYRDAYLRSKEWRNKRKAVLTRDNGLCRLCNDKGIDIHHISYSNLMREEWNQLITLCRNCHKKAHSKEDYIVNGITVNYNKLRVCNGDKHEVGCSVYHSNKGSFCNNCQNIRLKETNRFQINNN